LWTMPPKKRGLRKRKKKKKKRDTTASERSKTTGNTNLQARRTAVITLNALVQEVLPGADTLDTRSRGGVRNTT
jgi:hypothetical protein